LVLAAALWGTAGTATKYALRGFGPVTLLAVELTAASGLLWTVLLVRGYRRPASFPRVALLGLLEPALAYLGETSGLARTSASNGAVITGMESVFVVGLAAIFLRERVSRVLVAAVAVALLGLIVLEGSARWAGAGTGDMLVLAGALSAAGYSVVARGGRDPDPLAVTAHQFAVATLLVVPLAAHRWAVGAEGGTVPLPYWIAAVAVGTAGFAASFLLYNRAILTLNAGSASVIVNLIPAFGLLSAVLWLRETLTAGRLLGATLIGVSVVVFAVVEYRENRDGAGEPRGRHRVAVPDLAGSRP
jgi:drug/metabolite transporter (DMT)-like permease